MGSGSSNIRRAKRCCPWRRMRYVWGVGWRGAGRTKRTAPLRKDYRRGQRLRTDSGSSPAPRAGAGLRFAVRSLSGSNGQGKDKVRRLCWHLIHRGAVPLPLKGKDISALEWGRDFECRARLFKYRANNSSLLTPSSSLKNKPHPRGRWDGTCSGIYYLRLEAKAIIRGC